MANGVLKPYFFDSLLIPNVLTHVSATSTASAAIVVTLATIATVTPVERITVGGSQSQHILLRPEQNYPVPENGEKCVHL